MTEQSFSGGARTAIMRSTMQRIGPGVTPQDVDEDLARAGQMPSRPKWFNRIYNHVFPDIVIDRLHAKQGNGGAAADVPAVLEPPPAREWSHLLVKLMALKEAAGSTAKVRKMLDLIDRLEEELAEPLEPPVNGE